MTKTLATIRAEELKPGMVILPPAAEQKWMRRHCQEKGFSDSAMNLIVLEVGEGWKDKGGRWIQVKCHQTEEWKEGREQRWHFTFKARPDTQWPLAEGGF